MPQQRLKRHLQVEDDVRKEYHRMATTAAKKQTGLPIPPSPLNRPKIKGAPSQQLREMVALIMGAVPNNTSAVTTGFYPQGDISRMDKNTGFQYDAPQGQWYPSDGSIFLQDTGDAQRLYKTFLHELLHAAKGPFYPENAVRERVNDPIFDMLRPKRR